MSGNPVARKRGVFGALISALAAVVQNKPQHLVAALNAVPSPALLGCAARHRCVGELLRGIDTLGVGAHIERALLRQLQERCRRAALASYEYLPQLTLLVSALRQASVPIVLLKGAARLYASEPGAHWDELFDFDVLIRWTDAEPAAAKLLASGYSYSAENLDWYRSEHHHLAPLVAADGGLPVELHHGLAPPGLMSQNFDWGALAPYFETLDGPAGSVSRLNAAGSSLHLMIHGLGLRDSAQHSGGMLLERLRDAVLLAKHLRADPSLLETLGRIARADRLQSIGLEAVLHFAAVIAGLKWPCDASARRYVEYAIRREGLPPSLRRRVPVVADAWFGAGGRITRFVVRASTMSWRHRRLREKLSEPFRVAGRVAVGGLAVLYASLSRQTLESLASTLAPPPARADKR